MDVDAIRALADAQAGYASEAYRWLHRHPELSFQEAETARYVAEQLRSLDLEPRTGVGRRGEHGVVAVLGADRPGPAMYLSLPSPDHVPPFVMERNDRTTPGGIAVQPGPDGMLLIQRTLVADAPGRRYDVIDRAGSLRGTIRLPENRTIVGAGHSSLYVATRNNVDGLTLSRHPWPESPGASR